MQKDKSKALIVYVYDEIEREATGEAGHWWLHESLKKLEDSLKKEETKVDILRVDESGITVIALITIYLKSKGHLDVVNDSHLHDLAKFMFGFSVFWTYLWFSQFMLIWYANIPEEVHYFYERIHNYKFIYFGTFFINFVFPMVFLMSRDTKRSSVCIEQFHNKMFIYHLITFSSIST